MLARIAIECTSPMNPSPKVRVELSASTIRRAVVGNEIVVIARVINRGEKKILNCSPFAGACGSKLSIHGPCLHFGDSSHSFRQLSVHASWVEGSFRLLWLGVQHFALDYESNLVCDRDDISISCCNASSSERSGFLWQVSEGFVGEQGKTSRSLKQEIGAQ